MATLREVTQEFLGREITEEEWGVPDSQDQSDWTPTPESIADYEEVFIGDPNQN